MAKDGKPNQASPNVPPVNGESASPLEDIVKKYESSIDLLSQREYRLQNRIGAIQERLEGQQTILNDPNLTIQERIGAVKDVSTLEDLQQKLETQFDAAESHRLRGQTAGMQRQLRTHTTEARSRERISSMINRPDIFREGMKQMGAPTQQLYKSIERKKSQVNQLGSKIEDIFTGLEGEAIGEEQLAEVRGLGGQIAQLEREQAMEQSAIRQQRMGGRDPQGRLRRSAETLGRSGAFLEKRQIIGQAQRGEFGSLEEETGKLTKMFETLSSAQTNYQKSLEGSTEDQKKYSEALEEAREDVERQQRVTEAVRQYGGGGGMRGVTAADWARGAMGILGPGVDAARTIATTHNIQQMQMRAAYAGMGVQQYRRADAAIGGNMSALLEETRGQNFISGFANTLGGRAVGFEGGQVATGVVDTILNQVAGLANLEDAINPGDAIRDVAQAVGQRAAIESKRVSRMAKGITRGETGIPAEQAARQFVRQINAVDADVRQSVWDVKTGTYRGLQGAGSTATESFNQLTDPRLMAGWAALGLGQQERMEMMPRMIQAVGAQENLSGFMTSAAVARRSRMLSTDQFSQLTGQLAGVGGGTENLMDIMKSAVAAGMDNSKNIGQMVGAITQLSTQSAKMGIDVTGASSQLVAAGVQSLVSEGVSKNVASQVSATSLANWNKFATSGQFNLGNVMERAELRKMFPGAGVYQMNRLTQMSTEELRMFENAAVSSDADERDKARNAAQAMGIESMLYKNGKLDQGGLRKIRRAQTMGVLYNVAMPESITKDDLSQAADLIGAGRGDEVSENIRSALYNQGIRVTATGLGKVGQGAIGFPTGGDVGAAAATEQTQARRELDKFNEGIRQLTDVGGFKALAVAVEGLREAAMPDKMNKVIQDAAEKFQVPKGFEDGAGKIEKAGGVFERAANTLKDVLTEMGVKDWSASSEPPINRATKESPRTKATGRAGGASGPF